MQLSTSKNRKWENEAPFGFGGCLPVVHVHAGIEERGSSCAKKQQSRAPSWSWPFSPDFQVWTARGDHRIVRDKFKNSAVYEKLSGNSENHRQIRGKRARNDDHAESWPQCERDGHKRMVAWSHGRPSWSQSERTLSKIDAFSNHWRYLKVLYGRLSRMSPAVMRAVYFDLTEDATASTGCSPDVRGSAHEVVHQESFLRSAPTCGTWTRIHNKIWNGCATLLYNVWWVLSSKPWPKFFGPKKFWVDRPTLPFSRWRPETGNFLVWPCKKFYHKRIFSELGACPGSNETKGNSTCKEKIQKITKNTKIPKKIVTTEKFMRLIYNSIMWFV